MAAAYVRGMQSTGTAACLKHFICNETEFYRRRSKFGSNIVVSETPDEDEVKAADMVILSVGTLDMESFERPFRLPTAEENFARMVVAANPNTVVLVNSGSGIRMTGWNDKAAAILYGWYPGQNGMKAIADILAGDVNPLGKLPISAAPFRSLYVDDLMT